MSDISERISQKMHELGLKHKDVVLATNASKGTVSNWLNGLNIPTGMRLINLAKLLRTSEEWIISGGSTSGQSQSMGDMSQSQSQGVQWPAIADLPARHDGQPPSRQTPVISWVAAGDFTEVLSADLSRVIEWIPYNPRAGQYGFALIVEGVSMEPKFMPDDRIYVNPTFQMDELHTGDLVIMACDGDEKGTFKELVVEDGNYYLRPLNPNWQPRLMPVDHNCRLVGKVVGKFVSYS